MSQSLLILYIHFVFSTKGRKPFLKNENIRKEFYSYIGKIIINKDSYPIEIGSYEDHIHIFLDLSKKMFA